MEEWIRSAAIVVSVGFIGFIISWFHKRQLSKKIDITLETLDLRHTTTFNSTLDEFAAIEEKIVMVHQDILYFDQDLDDIEERVIRLEYRPNKTEPTTIDAQAIPSRVEMPLRRMKELRRRRRL